MTDASASSYVHANAAFDDELGRLHLLEARYDPCTFRRLSMFGPLAGARCLEVGAAAGSVARWLAARAGPSGQVVATDTNPRFLASLAEAGAVPTWVVTSLRGCSRAGGPGGSPSSRPGREHRPGMSLGLQFDSTG